MQNFVFDDLIAGTGDQKRPDAGHTAAAATTTAASAANFDLLGLGGSGFSGLVLDGLQALNAQTVANFNAPPQVLADGSLASPFAGSLDLRGSAQFGGAGSHRDVSPAGSFLDGINPLSAQHISEPSSPMMGASGSAGGANAKPVANQFATKLYQLVSDDANRDVIMWSPSGGSFLVLNQEELEKKILAVHFKHSKFASFQRQLNMYGFSKVNKSPRGNKAANDMMIPEFAHRYFIQGREDLLAEIKRRQGGEIDPLRPGTIGPYGTYSLGSGFGNTDFSNPARNIYDIQVKIQGQEQQLITLQEELRQSKQREVALADMLAKLILHVGNATGPLPNDLNIGQLQQIMQGSNNSVTTPSSAAAQNFLGPPNITVMHHDAGSAAAAAASNTLSLGALTSPNLPNSFGGAGSAAAVQSLNALTIADLSSPTNAGLGQRPLTPLAMPASPYTPSVPSATNQLEPRLFNF